MKDGSIRGAQPGSTDAVLTHTVPSGALDKINNTIGKAALDGHAAAVVAHAITNLENHAPPQTAVISITTPDNKEVKITIPDSSKGNATEQAAALVRALRSTDLNATERVCVAGMIQDMTSQLNGHSDVTRAGWVINVNSK